MMTNFLIVLWPVMKTHRYRYLIIGYVGEEIDIGYLA